MNIYEFDFWDGDKGIVFADSEEQARKMIMSDDGLDKGNPDEYVCCNYVCKASDKGIFVFE